MSSPPSLSLLSIPQSWELCEPTTDDHLWQQYRRWQTIIALVQRKGKDALLCSDAALSQAHWICMYTHVHTGASLLSWCYNLIHSAISTGRTSIMPTSLLAHCAVAALTQVSLHAFFSFVPSMLLYSTPVPRHEVCRTGIGCLSLGSLVLCGVHHTSDVLELILLSKLLVHSSSTFMCIGFVPAELQGSCNLMHAHEENSSELDECKTVVISCLSLPWLSRRALDG